VAEGQILKQDLDNTLCGVPVPQRGHAAGLAFSSKNGSCGGENLGRAQNVSELPSIESGRSGCWNDRSLQKSTGSLHGVRFLPGTCVK
jgi:hypothetical protein